jgi:hypothetical protein
MLLVITAVLVATTVAPVVGFLSVTLDALKSNWVLGVTGLLTPTRPLTRLALEDIYRLQNAGLDIGSFAPPLFGPLAEIQEYNFPSLPKQIADSV